MKVRRDGQYDGTFFGSLKWPETLVGGREIARFLRIAEKTAGKWLAQGRLPAGKDGRGRWMTTRRLLELWMMKGGMANDRRPRIGRGDQVAQESRREMDKGSPLHPTSSHPVPPPYLRDASLSDPETSVAHDEVPSENIPLFTRARQRGELMKDGEPDGGFLLVGPEGTRVAEEITRVAHQEDQRWLGHGR